MPNAVTGPEISTKLKRSNAHGNTFLGHLFLESDSGAYELTIAILHQERALIPLDAWRSNGPLVSISQLVSTGDTRF
jgi:hypothetical protein